jgi:glycerol-3-phosphate acyltransferase PlsY
MWPVFAGFNGEKGNSISVGVIATLTPFTFLFAIIPMLGGLLVKVTFHLAGSRQLLREKLKFSGPPSLSLPLGMIAGFLVLPFASHWLGDPEPVTISYIASLVLIIIRRATAGLKQDLVKGTDIGVILKNRILYDRPVI